MIKRVRHRGLRRLYADGTTRGLNADHIARLRLILAALDAAEAPGDMDIAGWRLHPLKGTRKGALVGLGFRKLAGDFPIRRDERNRRELRGLPLKCR